MKLISSKDNQTIKKFRSLSVKKYREQFGLYLIEGEKVVLEAVKLGGLVDSLIIQEGYETEILSKIRTINSDNVYVVTKDVFASLSSTMSPQPVIAVVKKKEQQSINPESNLLVLDRIQDPGNLGTIIRSAVAFGFNDIILIDSVDPYNDKTVRSASGTIFYPSFYEFKKDEFLQLAKKNNFNIVVAMANKTSVFDKNFKLKKPFALVIGNEGRGVCDDIINSASTFVSIPMEMCVESLNAGVSASILMLLLNKGQ